jgi:hypothetical protein
LTSSNQIVLGNSANTELKAGKLKINIAQTLTGSEEDYVLKYNHTTGRFSAEADATGTDDQTASEVSVAASPANYTAGSANVESHLSGIDTKVGTIEASIPDNITDLTISSTVDFDDNKITGVSNAEISSDAINKEQLDSLGTLVNNSHTLAIAAPSNGDTVTLTSRETLIVMDDTFADPATIYLDGSALSSGAKIYIKYGTYSSGLTVDRDDDNDPGNFVETGSKTGATSINVTGTGFLGFLKSGATWYQMY